MSYFDAAFAIVVGIEAGYTPGLPGDPGGETKFGISKRAYPNVDIAKLTLDEAKALYRRDYWDRAGCESMPWNLAVCALDCAINQGEHAEELIAQHTHQDAEEFMTQRALRYAESPNLARFGHSWMHRLFEVFKKAQVIPDGH